MDKIEREKIEAELFDMLDKIYENFKGLPKNPDEVVKKHISSLSDEELIKDYDKAKTLI